MKTLPLVVASLTLGCRGPEGDKSPSPDDTHTGGSTTDSPTDTDPEPTETGDDTHTGTPGSATASCAPTLHPQVFTCTVTLPAAGPATLTWSAAGATTRTFTSDAPAVTHEFVAWGLLPDTTYDWEVEGVTGQLTTGALPPGLAALDVTTSGTLFGADGVLIYVKCGYFVLLDGEGRVLWYLPTEVYDGFTDGMRWSDAERSVIAVTDSTMTRDTSEVLEVDVTGAELLHLTTAEFDLKLTHDVARWGDYTYLLGETAGRIGGFEVFQGTTRLGQWLLTDTFAGGGLTNAHVNGISVSELGEVLISVYGYSDLVAVDGDPASPTFLQAQWHAQGDPNGFPTLPNPDYVPDDPPLFRRQHAAARFGDEIWLFDNESQRDARALRLQLDPANGLMTELDSWSMGRDCPNQGGALPITGGVLATCANSDQVAAFRDATAQADWTLRATCGGGGGFPGGGSSTRAYPVVIH
jgi:hypothetical protein